MATSNLSLATGTSPIIFEWGGRWNGVGINHRRVRPGEKSEAAQQDHRIFIPLDGAFSTEIWSATGRKQVTRSSIGRSYICPAGQLSSSKWNQELEYLCIWVEPTLVFRAASDSPGAPKFDLVNSCNHDDPLIRQIGMGLARECRDGKPGGRLYAESLGNLLAVHLLRHYCTEVCEPRCHHGGLAGKALSRAIDFMRDHLDQDITLADIAASAGISQFHFARAFKQSTGLAPHQYLTQTRIDRARTLLAEEELPIIDVCFKVGFESLSHFTTLFRKQTGLTPAAYRARA